MRDPKWIGTAPSGVVWSDDARWIYFQWNPEGKDFSEIYRIAPGGATPERVEIADLEQLAGTLSAFGAGLSLNLRGSWDRARRRKVYSSGGDLWLYDVRRGSRTRLMFTTDSESSPLWSSDERRILFTSGGDHFSLDLESGELRQHVHFQAAGSGATGPAGRGEGAKTELQKWLERQQEELLDYIRDRRERRERQQEFRSRIPSPVRPVSVSLPRGQQRSGSTISTDGRFVAFRARIPGPAGQRANVPDYVTEDGFTRDIPTREKVGEPLDRYRLGIVDTERDTTYYIDFSMLDDLVAEPLGPANQDGNWKDKRGAVIPISPSLPVIGPDNRRAVLEVRSLDHKDRFLLGLDLLTGAIHMADHQHDEAWIGGPIFGVGWMPDGERFWYMSEKTGYAHLYTKDWVGTGARALTEGEFEVYGPRMDRARERWFFQANDVHPGVRHFYSMPIAGGEWSRYTDGEGQHNVTVSPDERWMADLYSRANHPAELYVKRLRPEDELRQITESTSEEWRSYAWTTPPVITFTARDGAEVYARLYKPDDWQRGGPAVVFVHGAGYLQNAHKWWSSYFREYMFHHLLMERGFMVLDIDYRASSGYGRDWRTGIYRFMGGKDLTDQVDGAAWLVREHGVDPGRIGIYGGSYGGFITLMAMFTEPDVFAAGAALRPVTDWAHYNHGYTSNILNVPQADTLAYDRSSPINHAEGLTGALLICHGLVDTNVHAQDSIRLAQRLIELRKENWELALFPVENHGFSEPTSWMDEYKRILKLFEMNLKQR
jgi:dipeptidyl aminopeptidase/acylaminoacyl peptidase